MLADLDETIRRLLIDELPVKNGEIEISFDQPEREWSSRLSRPTVNLFLYDVRENNVLRQHQWQQLNGGRTPSTGSPANDAAPGLVHMKRTPMRVDATYVLSTWAADPTDEHRLLTRCMLALFRYPILPADRLIGTLQNPPYDIQAKLAQHDALTDPTDLWNVMDNEMRPGVSYVITLALDPWQEITGPLVRTRILRFGQAQGLPSRRALVPDEARTDLVVIAGSVRSGTDGAPVPAIEVALKGTGYLATADAEGRFVLGSVPPGDYTLVAWPGEGKPKQRQIRIPAADGDYDMEV